MKISDSFKMCVLILLVLSSGVLYVNYSQKNLRMRIDNDKTTFYTIENGRWVVSGREYNKMFSGTHLLYRDVKSINVSYVINDNNSFTISRLTNYKKGPQIIDTYKYKGNITSEKQFPVSHTINVKNAKGLIYQYEVRNLVYDGPTVKNVKSPMSFGRNMFVEWEPSNYWSTIYKSGILKLRFRPQSDNEIYSIRLFDPTDSVWNDSTSIVSGLPTIVYSTAPAGFEKNDTLYLIVGNSSGVFDGFDWNGSAWESNADIVNGLGDIGKEDRKSVV